MKVTFFLLFMVSFLRGYCDTLDFYHVYLNDDLIGEFNSFSDDPSITLKKSNLKKDDVITVKYGNDVVCVECVYVLSVVIDVKEKTPQAETTEYFGKLSIPINELLYFKNKYEIEKFHFNYHIQNKNSNKNKGVYLFELTII